jgi:type I restriction enzyme R subunit
LDKNEDLAIALNDKIINTRKAGWRGNPIKEREVRIAVRSVLKEFAADAADEVDRIFEIVKKQQEY